MNVRVDGKPISPDALYWPLMNFGQFRWEGRVGEYELEFPRTEFVHRLEPIYQPCVVWLRIDDEEFPSDPSPLKAVGYPGLDELLNYPDLCLEFLDTYLWEEILEEFLPRASSAGGQFMVNSIDAISATQERVVLRGRGYHRNSA